MLAEMADSSRNAVQSMSDIVWSIDSRHDTLGDVVSRLRAYGSGVLGPGGTRWTFEAPEGALGQKLSPGQRRQLYLILKEAIHNMARHSQASHAVLRIRLEGAFLSAEIEDDGRGFDPRHDIGLGIRSMRSRGEQLGGAFEVSARPGGGVRARLRFPLLRK